MFFCKDLSHHVNVWKNKTQSDLNDILCCKKSRYVLYLSFFLSKSIRKEEDDQNLDSL